MKVANAIKKLSKFCEVKEDGKFGYYGFIGNEKVAFSRNGNSDEITCIHTMHKDEQSDSMTDYFPMTWHDNLTQAISFAQRIQQQ